MPSHANLSICTYGKGDAVFSMHGSSKPEASLTAVNSATPLVLYKKTCVYAMCGDERRESSRQPRQRQAQDLVS